MFLAYRVTTPRCLSNSRSAHEKAQFAKAMAAIPFSLPLLSGADDSFVAQTFCKSDHFIGIIPAILMQVFQSRLYGSETAASLRLSIAIFRRQVPPGSTSAQYPEIPFSMYYTILFFTTQLNDSAYFRRVFKRSANNLPRMENGTFPQRNVPLVPLFPSEAKMPKRAMRNHSNKSRTAPNTAPSRSQMSKSARAS